MTDFVDRFFDAHLAAGMLTFFVLPAIVLLAFEAGVSALLRARRRAKRRKGRDYGGW